MLLPRRRRLRQAWYDGSYRLRPKFEVPFRRVVAPCLFWRVVARAFVDLAFLASLTFRLDRKQALWSAQRQILARNNIGKNVTVSAYSERAHPERQ
jgi:hypothetical protein